MRGKIGKWGNSSAVIIPASLLEAANLALGAEVDISMKDGSIVIQALEPEYSLDALVAGITPANQHVEVSFGSPAGRETH